MTTLSLPEAAQHLGVPVRVLRRAIRQGSIPAPAGLNALSHLSQEWLASAQMAAVSNPKAFSVFPQKVPAFARFEGTSFFRDDPIRVKEYNMHRAKLGEKTAATI